MPMCGNGGWIVGRLTRKHLLGTDAAVLEDTLHSSCTIICSVGISAKSLSNFFLQD